MPSPIEPGDVLVIFGSKFADGETVTVVLLAAVEGQDLVLGEAVANANGNLALDVPAETFRDVERGTYTLQATGDAGSSVTSELEKSKP